MKKATLFFLLTTIVQVCWAQINLQVSAPSRVAEGDRFEVRYILNADGENFRGPSFTGFRRLSGPNQSNSTSIQFVNGKMSKEITSTFSHFLQALAVGEYTIDAATVRVNGKLYRSKPITIAVVKAGNSSGNSNQAYSGQNSNAATENQQTTTKVASSDDVFIKARISNTNPYLGEQVLLSYKIYTKVNISQLQPKSDATYPGFWIQELNSGETKQQTEYINGQEYITLPLKEVAIFPMKSGEIKIKPYEMNVIAQYQKKRTRKQSNDPFDAFFNDSFFNMGVQNVEINVKSKGFTVKVKSLPEAGKPANFTGAVGSYKLTSSISHEEVKTNEAITLRYIISGKGNIPSVKPPDIVWHSDFDVFDPKVEQNVKKNNYGVSGSITYEYLILPRSPGDFEVPALDFSYFDPKNKSYKRLHADAYDIKVTKGEGHSSGISYSAVSQEDVRYIGSDIRHIKMLPFTLKPMDVFFFGSTLFNLLLVGSLLLLVVTVILVRSFRKKHGNYELMRNKRATKVAIKRLKKSQYAMKSNDAALFFEEVSTAIWGFLSDKFSIEKASLSMDTVSECLTEKGVSEELIAQIVEILNSCEFARFAPGDKQQNMQQIYKDTLQIISKIEQGLK